MLGKQDGANDFLDCCVEQRLLPKNHELLDIDAKIDFSFVEQEIGDLCCSDNRCSSYPPPADVSYPVPGILLQPLRCGIGEGTISEHPVPSLCWSFC